MIDNSRWDPYQVLVGLQNMDVQITRNMAELSQLVVDIARAQDQIRQDIERTKRDIAHLYNINTLRQTRDQTL